jgi:O-antigen ligase
VLGYFVMTRCVKTKKELQFLFYAFLLSIILVALFTWQRGMLAGPHFADFKRSSGPFALDWSGADIAGGFLAIFTPLLLSYFLLVKKNILKFIAFIGLAICLLGIFATYSRGSIFALAIASVVVVLVAAKYFMKTSKISAIIILIIFIGSVLGWQRWVPESIVNRIQGTVKEQTYGYESSLDQSSEKRIDIWKAGMELFWSNPLTGVGFKRPEYELGVDTHNAFILIAAEMGIFGILVFLWFLWRVFREAISFQGTEFIFLGIGCIGCMTAFIVVNMFYSNFFRDTVVGSFWIMLGMLAVSKRYAFQEKIINNKKR